MNPTTPAGFATAESPAKQRVNVSAESRARGAAPLISRSTPSPKAPEAPGGSRASLVGQHVVVVLDDVRVRRGVSISALS